MKVTFKRWYEQAEKEYAGRWALMQAWGGMTETATFRFKIGSKRSQERIHNYDSWWFEGLGVRPDKADGMLIITVDRPEWSERKP